MTANDQTVAGRTGTNRTGTSLTETGREENMNEIEIPGQNSRNDDRSRCSGDTWCSGDTRCICLNGMTDIRDFLDNAVRQDDPAGEIAAERLALIERVRASLQERGGHTDREARALIARDMAAREIQGILDFAAPRLGEAHPGMVREALEHLCMDALEETSWGDGCPPPPWEIGRRFIRTDLERALREGGSRETREAYGQVVRIAMALHRIQGALHGEIEEDAEAGLKEFQMLDDRRDQLEWLESSQNLLSGETGMEAGLSMLHLDNARGLLLGWMERDEEMTHGGSGGVIPEARVGITLYEIHLKRRQWDQPGLRLAAWR